MCRQATCPECKHKSWTGCGHHIASVMDRINRAEWCTCPGGSEYPPQAEVPLTQSPVFLLLLLVCVIGGYQQLKSR